MLRVILGTSLFLLILTACSEPRAAQDLPEAAPPDHVELLGRGEAIAENLCAKCHAIGITGESPHPDAVPLRQLSWKYPVDELEQPFLQGIVVGHPDMPEWQFTQQDVDALLAYIESIQEPQTI